MTSREHKEKGMTFIFHPLLIRVRIIKRHAPILRYVSQCEVLCRICQAYRDSGTCHRQ